jgi:hypothetical protein
MMQLKDMQAIMMLFDSELSDEVFMLMKLSETINYTYFKGLHGSGNQGKKEGSIMWPGTNELVLLLVNEEQLSTIKQRVKEYKESKDGPVGLILFNWNLNEVII